MEDAEEPTLTQLDRPDESRGLGPRRAAGLRRACELIGAELELAPLLERLLASAVELTDASCGTLCLVAEGSAGPRATVAAAHNLPAATIGRELAVDHGLAGHILRVGRAVRLARYGELQQLDLPALAEHAALGVPLLQNHRLVGVLCVAAPPPARFDEDDLELMAALARQGALALANARRFAAERQRSERIALINRVARLITSSLSFEELFQTAVDTIRANFGYSYLGAGIIDPDDPDWLMLLAQSGTAPHLAPAGYRHPREAGLLGAALNARRTLLINNVERDPRYLALLGDPEVRAELVVPIIVGERVVGVLNVESHSPISEDEAESIEVLAEQFGAAIENARLFGETQRALEATRLLYDVSRRLSAAMSVEEVIRAYLEEVAARGRYVCTVALYDSDTPEDRTTVLVQGAWSPDHGLRMGQIPVPHSRDPLDDPLDAGETVVIADVHSDPRCTPTLRAVQAADERPALAMIPLLARGRRIGLVILSYNRPHEWPLTALRIYQTTASQLASAIDSRTQHGLLAERSREVAVLEERRRLARELHDSVTQSLFSLSLLAQVLPELWQIDQGEARHSLAQVRDLTRCALAEMRELLYELRPGEMGDQDLVHAMRTRAGAFERRSGLRATVEGPAQLHLAAEPAQALLRIVQEALTNIDHHAAAQGVRLELRPGPPLTLRIRDDGRGFDPARVPEGRLGLVSMRERAAAIGASLTIEAAPGAGTTITISWPAPERGAAPGANEGAGGQRDGRRSDGS